MWQENLHFEVLFEVVLEVVLELDFEVVLRAILDLHFDVKNDAKNHSQNLVLASKSGQKGVGIRAQSYSLLSKMLLLGGGLFFLYKHGFDIKMGPN